MRMKSASYHTNTIAAVFMVQVYILVVPYNILPRLYLAVLVLAQHKTMFEVLGYSFSLRLLDPLDDRRGEVELLALDVDNSHSISLLDRAQEFSQGTDFVLGGGPVTQNFA